MNTAVAISNSSAIAMTTREIAELTGKEHKHVVRDTLAMLDTLGVTAKGYAQIWTNPQNLQQYTEYALPKDLSLTLVSGYSVVMRKRIIDRWLELEAGQFKLPSHSEALRLYADQLEITERQQAAIAAAAPKVAFVDRYVECTGNKGFRQVCKLLGANEADFREFLLDKKIMYRLNGEWAPHAQHQGSGRFVVKAGTSEISSHAYNQALFTPKGVNWVAGEWAKYQLSHVPG